MSLKYVAAFLMASLSGTESPTASDVQTILGAVGAEVDESIVSKLISTMEGKTVHEVIAAGMSTLQSSCSSGTQVSATSNAAAPASGEPVEEVKEAEEEEEEDMGFSLFD